MQTMLSQRIMAYPYQVFRLRSIHSLEPTQSCAERVCVPVSASTELPRSYPSSARLPGCSAWSLRREFFPLPPIAIEKILLAILRRIQQQWKRHAE